MPNEKYDNLRGNETYPIAHILSSDVFQQVIYEIFPPYTYYGSWRILYNSKENLNLLKHITEEVKKGPSLFVVSIYIGHHYFAQFLITRIGNNMNAGFLIHSPKVAKVERDLAVDLKILSC